MRTLAFMVQLILASVFLLPNAEASEGKSIALAGLSVVYWQPPPSAAKQPLLLFSHGYRGCATQSTFLMEALSDAGYWVFAPNHADALCHRTTSYAIGSMDLSFLEPETWTSGTFVDRRDNMWALFDALQQDPRFNANIDFARVGAIGHSLGGYTAMALGGAWPDWKMAAVKAVLAFSPYSAPFNLQQSVKTMTVPVMFQGGTGDLLITPFTSRANGSYDQAVGSKYYIEFSDANHMAWTNFVKRYQPSIIAYSIAFLDHYVKGLPATRGLTSMRDDVWQMRYESDLGSHNNANPVLAPAPVPSPIAKDVRPLMDERLRERLQQQAR
jgi:predicted dienelactone hydrolase